MPRFLHIADGFDTMALALSVTGLEGAGFAVLTPGRHLDSILPNTSAALGPVPILVPEAQAEDAAAFLRAIAPDGVRVLSRPEYLPGQDPTRQDRAPPEGWFARLWQRFVPPARPDTPRHGDDYDR